MLKCSYRIGKLLLKQHDCAPRKQNSSQNMTAFFNPLWGNQQQQGRTTCGLR